MGVCHARELRDRVSDDVASGEESDEDVGEFGGEVLRGWVG